MGVGVASFVVPVGVGFIRARGGAAPGPSTATVTTLTPSTTTTNSGITVTVTGTGFTAATEILASGVSVQTTYVNATTLTTTYLGTVAAPDTINIRVIKPGEQPSNSQPFTVTAAVGGLTWAQLVGPWSGLTGAWSSL